MKYLWGKVGMETA